MTADQPATASCRQRFPSFSLWNSNKETVLRAADLFIIGQRFHIIVDGVNQTADKRAKVWLHDERGRKRQKCGRSYPQLESVSLHIVTPPGKQIELALLHFPSIAVQITSQRNSRISLMLALPEGGLRSPVDRNREHRERSTSIGFEPPPAPRPFHLSGKSSKKLEPASVLRG